VDTTAAGDAFNGAFAVALSEGRKPVEAAEFAAAAAAISVTRRGAQPSMPTRGEIDTMLQSHSSNLLQASTVFEFWAEHRSLLE
jgi:ribokinase